MSKVVVRDTKSREVLWEHEVTGAPLIDYVPAKAWNAQDAGLVTIGTEEDR